MFRLIADHDERAKTKKGDKQKMIDHDYHLISLVLPQRGDRIKVADYRNTLMQNSYNWHQAIGSLGGASSAG